jgi:hypothetical protein
MGLVRTLGGDTNQVAPERGGQRRIAIGEVLRGPGSPVLQSLPRDLSLSPGRALMQAFVPELQSLRRHDTAVAWRSAANESASPVLLRGSQMEVVLRVQLLALPPSGGGANASSAAVEIRFMQLDGEAMLYTSVGLDVGRMHLYVDGSKQGGRRNSGPLYPPPPSADRWTQLHVIVDGGVVTAIGANNRTAITACVLPANVSFDGLSVVAAAGGGVAAAQVEAWLLSPAN